MSALCSAVNEPFLPASGNQWVILCTLLWSCPGQGSNQNLYGAQPASAAQKKSLLCNVCLAIRATREWDRSARPAMQG